MGEFVKDMYGCTIPHVMKFAIGASFANAGVLVEAPNGDDAGVTPCSTTTAADVVGISNDTATYVTAQQTDGTSANRVISVVVNPLGVYRYLMSGGATEGTALTQYDVSTASSDGLTITTGDDWTSPQFDEGAIWGFDGANSGQLRKITTTSSTAAAVTVAFDYDTVVGDNFLRAPYWPADATALTLQFTTNLYQANAAIAVGTGAAVNIVELMVQDKAGAGDRNSYVHFTSRDCVWNLAT